MANLMKHPNQPSEKDLDEFLSKVDEIENVIRGLSSNDEEKRSLYIHKADKMIDEVKNKGTKKDNKNDSDDDDEGLPQTKTGFSKTSINKDCYKNETAPMSEPVLIEGMDQKAFMAAMEADAKERAENKKEREKIANKLREQGNTEFREGNFRKALELYTEAIKQIRGSLALYTNRAQARIKLSLYTEALKDCDLAIRLSPSCIKAYLHQGHAYLGLREFDKARDSYRYILTLDPKKENLVQDCVANVNRIEEAGREEVKVSQMFESGDVVAKGVVEILDKIKQKDQHPLYYCGGFRVLTSVLKDNDACTLFRTNGGLQLPRDHPLLCRCLTAPVHSLSKEEMDVLSAAFEMLTSTCRNNEINQQLLLSLPEFPLQMMSLLEFKGQVYLLDCLNLLHEISLTSAGRASIVGKFDVDRLITSLFPLMNKPYDNTSAAILTNITLENRVKSLVRDKIEERILPAFETFLKTNPPAVIASLVVSAAINLAADQKIRNKMAARKDLWDSTGHLLGSYICSKHTVALEYLLGLLLNLSTTVSPDQSISVEVFQNCLSLTASGCQSDKSLSWALGVLSNLLPHNTDVITSLSLGDKTPMFLNFMKSPDPAIYKPALKLTTILAQNVEQTRQIIEQNKGLSVLLNFLTLEDEVVIGNAALCLSHLSQSSKVCTKLTKTNIIQKLLELARDIPKTAVQSNCAILVGKLVQGDSRHLDRLRELHGIEILHGCMKYIK